MDYDPQYPTGLNLDGCCGACICMILVHSKISLRNLSLTLGKLNRLTGRQPVKDACLSIFPAFFGHGFQFIHQLCGSGMRNNEKRKNRKRKKGKKKRSDNQSRADGGTAVSSLSGYF